MNHSPSMTRKMYDGFALFAVLNTLGLTALAVYLVGSGAVDPDKVRRIAAVMRGTGPVDDEGDADGNAENADGDGREQPTDTVTESEVDKEVLRRESERIKAELDQRLALNNSIMLRVTAAREQFQRERDEARRKQQAALEEQQDEGFQKQVAIFESLAPKTAAQHLLAMSDMDEAAGLLLQMRTRSARRIVEAARRGPDLEKMRQILMRLREVSPERSDELMNEE